MSVDISWDTVTGGPDGEVLAEKIRGFVHEKFQQIQLPRFIKSVQVHSFAFGSACPSVTIKDVSDPLPTFYEDDEDDDSGASNATPSPDAHTFRDRDPFTAPLRQAQLLHPGTSSATVGSQLADAFASRTYQPSPQFPIHPNFSAVDGPRLGTPGIPGGTSNLSYFHLPMSGLSGTNTPLAAVASGNHFPPAGWHQDMSQTNFAPSHSGLQARLDQRDASRALSEYRDPSSRPSTAQTVPNVPGATSPLDPASPERLPFRYTTAEKVTGDPLPDTPASPPPTKLHPSQPSDLQVVSRVEYSGDVRMTLTAEILLDYPMPSFVGIPLKLSITGINFDGVAIVAYIRKRMHFCFLDPEDAETLVGDHVTGEQQKTKDSNASLNGLLKEIRIESEIGRQESGKQVLKNVGKVEKFVLEQIRRIFEEEFVFPSFWTFLV